MTCQKFRELAMSLPGTTEEPHHDKTSFRVKKKIFATMNETAGRATLKLSEQDQDLFGLADPSLVYPVPNKWGKHGWTHIELNRADAEMVMDALHAAYHLIAPTKG